MKSDDYFYCLTPSVRKIHTQPEFKYLIESNSFGFRGQEPQFEAGFRVLVLGDSVGMGAGVPEGRNLCDMAQAHIEENGQDADIFNTSISGYSTLNELKVLNRWINEYGPHLVIYLFSWNDVYGRYTLDVRDGYLVPYSDKFPLLCARVWLNRHSRLYCLIKKFYYSITTDLDKKDHLLHPSDSQIRIILDDIKTMDKVSHDAGAGFVTIITTGVNIHPDSTEFMLKALGKKDIKFYDWSAPETGGYDTDIYFKRDSHWNEKGHRKYGRYLYRIIDKAINGEL